MHACTHARMPASGPFFTFASLARAPTSISRKCADESTLSATGERERERKKEAKHLFTLHESDFSFFHLFLLLLFCLISGSWPYLKKKCPGEKYRNPIPPTKTFLSCLAVPWLGCPLGKSHLLYLGRPGRPGLAWGEGCSKVRLPCSRITVISELSFGPTMFQRQLQEILAFGFFSVIFVSYP